MKTRIIATVLALVMLCPMIAYLGATDANAALEVDDGISRAPSDILCEEWNFNDMSDGEVLTDRYISSHARGDFGGLSKITESLCTPEKYSAVKDSESGNVYIHTDNAFIGFEDDGNLLLKGAYEISWRMRLETCSSATTLLW